MHPCDVSSFFPSFFHLLITTAMWHLSEKSYIMHWISLHLGVSCMFPDNEAFTISQLGTDKSQL